MLALLCSVSCTATPAPTPPSTKAGSSQPHAEVPPSNTRPAPPVNQGCLKTMPRSWRQAVDAGRVPAKLGDGRIRPTAVGPDGEALFGELAVGDPARIDGASKKEIVRYDFDSRTWSPIYAMPDAATDQQVDGVFDGQRMVFALQHSLTTYDDWSVHVWDQQTNEVRVLDQDAGFRGPLIYVDASAGKAVWSKAVGKNIVEVHLYDLAASRDRVIARGQIGTAWIVGDLVIWPQIVRPGSQAVFQAASLTSGNLVETPPGLSKVGPLTQIAASGSTLVWIEGNFRAIRAWRIGWPEPRTVFDSGRDRGIDDVNVAGDIVSWHSLEPGQPVYLGDMRTGSCTQVTERNGYTVSNKDAMVVIYPESKSSFGAFVVRPSRLPPLPEK
ncbi:hypothetical protein [Nonomuraea candida]|uniref:hypothetical protein n=1 Tax=Nonomuraea candida TaxID=359159 RepID=UPI0012FC2C86|nr:hypothetical protein [Nonomuraea candida]